MDPNAGGTEQVTQSTPQDQQQATAQPGQQSADGGTSQGGSQERSSGSNKNGWLQTWLLGGGTSTTTDTAEPASRQDATEAQQRDGTGGQAKPATDKADQQPLRQAVTRAILKGDPDEKLNLTRSEVTKIAQSWKDAEIAEDNRRNAEMAATRATAAQWQKLRELADPVTGDPDKLQEAVQELLSNQQAQAQVNEQTGRILDAVRDVGTRYDTELVQPVLDLLPANVADAILKDAPSELVGVAHRAHILRTALAKLKETWTAQATEAARQKLRGNEAFRKDVLHEARGNLPEPELVPATGNGAAPRDLNTWFRQALS